MAVTLEVLGAQGERVASQRLPMYYAEFFHYANNFAIPRDGEYKLRATIGAPALRRHGEEVEPPPLREGATATFDGVRLERREGGE